MSYYKSYYQRKKHIYKARYEEQKRARVENELLFRQYGGEENYYRMRLLDFGVKINSLIIEKK